MASSIIGKKFGNLTVLDVTTQKKSNGALIYRCLCDCGSEHYTISSYLLDGRTTSCGCNRKHIMTTQKYSLLPNNESAFNSVFRSYKIGSKHRCLEFSISKEDFGKLTQQNCFYCGAEPSTTRTVANSTYIYNGIDRVDNSIGYVLNNCVPCCSKCNRIKRAVTVNICKKVTEFMTLKEKERE